MKREEIEKAIDNGESVWLAHKNRLFELCPDMSVKLNNSDKPDFAMTKFEFDNGGIIIKSREYWGDLLFTYEDILKNKAEAEHYLHHANITRTETLPFLTWEEFLNKERIIFTTPTRFICALSYLDNILTLSVGKNNECTRRFVWDLTEANFYKAYDECVRLFRGGE